MKEIQEMRGRKKAKKTAAFHANGAAAHNTRGVARNTRGAARLLALALVLALTFAASAALAGCYSNGDTAATTTAAAATEAVTTTAAAATADAATTAAAADAATTTTAAVAETTQAAATQAAETAGGASGSSASAVINLMFPTEVTTLDPSNLNGNPDSTVLGAVYEGLYRTDEANNVVPGVADAMPEISSDGLTYTIKLRPGVKWSNGDAVTAGDFVYSWQELIKTENAYLYSFIIQGIIANAAEIASGEMDAAALGVKAIDDATLEVSLVAPTPYFTSLLTFAPLYPKNAAFAAEKGKTYGTSSENAVYNGPFIIENWDQNSLSMDLRKNPAYTGGNAAKSENIHYEVIKVASTALNLYDAGQLDAAELTGEIASQSVNNPDYQAFNTGTITYIRMNQERTGNATVLANADLRKALALGIDKKLLCDRVIADGSSPLNGLIPAGFVNNPSTGVDFRTEAGDVMPYNQDEAKKYWESAKAALGDKISVELMVSDDERYVSIAEALKGMYESLFEGLTVELLSLPQDTALAKARLTGGSDYDMFLIMWTPDYQDPISTLNVWNEGNSQHYANQAYFDLYNKAGELAGTDLTERWNTLIAAEKLVLEDAGTIAVCTNGVSTLINPALTGMNYHSFSTITNLSPLEKK
ncbi:MAG: peptide ABC transporter substrate-binding protein [Clostridiales bacterium]|jgi:oligopeptide transport system substrate-binding protein|nr:peptide ABC transporter substrate-binding protein [Clostridiales bacterium]